MDIHLDFMEKEDISRFPFKVLLDTLIVIDLLLLSIIGKYFLFTISAVIAVLIGFLLRGEGRYIKQYFTIGIILIASGAIIFFAGQNYLGPAFGIGIASEGMFLLVMATVAYLLSPHKDMKHPKKQKEKYLKFVLAIAILISFLQSFLIFQGKFYNHVDSGLENFPPNLVHIYDSFFIWNKPFYLGSIASSISNLPVAAYQTINLLFVSLFGNILGTELFYGALFAVGNIALVYLIYKLLQNHEELVKALSCIFAIFIFFLYFYPQYGASHNAIPALLPPTMLLLYTLFEEIERGTYNMQHVTIASLWLTVLFSVDFDGGYIFSNLILVLPLLLYAIFSSKNRLKQAKIFSLVFILAILVALPLLGSTASFLIYHYGTFFNEYSVRVLLNFNKQDIFSSLQLYGIQVPSLMLQYGNNTPLLIIVQLLILATSLSAFIFMSGKAQRIWVIGLLISLLITFFLYTNLGMPFGFFFLIMLELSNLMLIFRAAGPILYYIFFFIEAVLFAISIAAVYERANKFKFLFVGFCILLILVRTYYFDFVPLQNTTTFVIPQYAYETASFINNQTGNFNVATLPAEYPFGHYATYYYGTNIYSYLIDKHNTFTGGYISATREHGPVKSENEYAQAANVIQRSILRNSTYVETQFGNMGIKYIVVQGDTAPSGLNRNYSYIQYNLTRLYENLNRSYGVKLAAQFENTSIYEIYNYSPLVFVNEGHFPANYTEITPVKFKVVMSGTLGMTNLRLRQEFDSWWVATYSNGTVLSNHTNYRGINSWDVDCTQSCKIEITYIPQKLIDYLQIVSAATFLGLIGAFFFYNNKEKKKLPTIH